MLYLRTFSLSPAHLIVRSGPREHKHTDRSGRWRSIAAAFPEIHVWRLKNGKVIEFREYQGDEQREDQF